MIFWDVVNDSKNNSVAAAEYFQKLVDYFDKKSNDLRENNHRLEHEKDQPGIIFAEITKHTGSGPEGIPFTEYKARSRNLKVFCNWPTGFVVAELTQVFPNIGKRKAWALKLQRDDFGQWTISKIGDFLGERIAHIPAFSEFLLEQLVTEEVTMEMLEAWSTTLE